MWKPSSSEPAELQRCVFADSLVTVSEGGRALGNFTVTVEFARKDQQPCMLLHAQSQGTIDHCPCGTTVTGEGKPLTANWAVLFHICVCKHLYISTQAYLTTDLEVLEEHYHEYVKVSLFKLPIHCIWKYCQRPAHGLIILMIHNSCPLKKHSFLSSLRTTVWKKSGTWCSVATSCWSIKLQLRERWHSQWSDNTPQNRKLLHMQIHYYRIWKRSEFLILFPLWEGW